MNDLQVELYVTVQRWALDRMPMSSAQIDAILAVLQELMPRG